MTRKFWRHAVIRRQPLEVVRIALHRTPFGLVDTHTVERLPTSVNIKLMIFDIYYGLLGKARELEG